MERSDRVNRSASASPRGYLDFDSPEAVVQGTDCIAGGSSGSSSKFLLKSTHANGQAGTVEATSSEACFRDGVGSSSGSHAPLSDEEVALRLQQEFDREVEEKEKRARFECPICLQMATFDASVQLDCLHRTCRECFFEFLRVHIREKRVTTKELRCPVCSAVEITVLQVQGATAGNPLWDRFLDCRRELWRPGTEDEDCVLCNCGASGCESFLAPCTLKEVKCPGCNKIFCPSCGELHRDMSCEEYKRSRPSGDAADQAFQELMRQECWQRCPTCCAPCIRDSGCNFMSCHSSRCRGENWFCYLCGEQLKVTQKFSHFPHGVWENACEKVDRRNDENLPAAGLHLGRGQWSDFMGDVVRWAHASLH
eukprot:TRINITY_DN61451_c0_g1_i1.p1 TRINITY_DN61451_c0_g1~~TRINITY_DN61451_c0_g1_i1.p1  ORF type:complete len:367 (+),score=58.36 TRINITY_DN61451_c0_g1_i1:39-1139(+)